MDKLLKAGRIIFSIGIIGLGILSIVAKDFIVGRPPAGRVGFTFTPALAGTILIISALALLFHKKARAFSLLIAVLIFLLSILRHIPHFMNDWLNAYKSIALFGGALIVASSFPGTQQRSNKVFVFIGCLSLAAFFIASGYAHFKFANFVIDFIPGYIPFHAFWTYFCGICLFAGGIGLLIPPLSKWAALFSGIMLSGWFLLLHIPRFITNMNDASDRMGLFESFTFAGIFFTLAGVLSGTKSSKI